MDRPPTRFGSETAPGRRFPKGANALLCLLLAGSLGCDAVVGRTIEAAVERQRSAGHTEWLDDGALHVVLCGTGSPLPDPTSAAACTAVVAGGRVSVVDVGPGSQEVAQLIGLPRAALGGVLLTHFHSDHIGELGEWAMQSWVAGRKEAFRVFGPPGVARVAGGFQQAYGLDDEYRIAHHGLDNMPRSATEWTVHEVLLKDVIEQLSEGFGRAGEPRLQRLSADIIDYHTSPAEALQAAQDAGVDTMVMTHLVPPIPGRLRSWFFTRGLESGDVDVVVGEDGMHFRLPAASDTIEQESLGS